ncbi:MAG: hypothetical protein KJ838_00095, partial [Candidatus Omnitrophica bacterium]|nr:hypothetical protein [Candidatus Omnitrophota bacterium]
MRVIVLATLILCFSITYAFESQAFWWGGEKTEKPSKVKEVMPKGEGIKEPTEQKKEAEKKIPELQVIVDVKQALIEKKRKLLNNTKWEIELSLLTGKGKKQSDIITFSNNQIASANLIRSGFSATNYTLTIQEDVAVIWETMQTSEKSGIAFWRGEVDLNIEKMQGI